MLAQFKYGQRAWLRSRIYRHVSASTSKVSVSANWCTHRCFSEGKNVVFSWCAAVAHQPRVTLKEWTVSLPHAIRVVVVLSNTFSVMYVTWYYERLKPFLRDSCHEAGMKLIELFLGRTVPSIRLQRPKATITQEPGYAHIQEEKKYFK